jgi:hypothetical protein
MKMKTLPSLVYLSFYALFIVGCNPPTINRTAGQWMETEIDFQSASAYENPYTDVDFWVEFTHESGLRLVRPGFWNEGNHWKVRFASPMDAGEWQWKSFASDQNDAGLHGLSGTMVATPYSGVDGLVKNGLLLMSPGKRNVIHANGKSFFMTGDTPWALPWRGTLETVTVYAKNRQETGFNTALLMSLQPDRDAVGPQSRDEHGGFGIAFHDLKEGHINRPDPEYFMLLDSLRDILIDHGIVPVFQPVFHGFGWKGLNVLGWNVDPGEYTRYCRYLVARYGAKPAMWLVGADSDGRNTGVKEAGEEIEKWDAYKQPAGLHYSPFDDKVPDWMSDMGGKYEPHMNRSFQDAEWLDFQWCQTGHSGEHLFHKVALMYDNKPVKAVANGEPTYEGISKPDNGSGWWQGHEAWGQFLSGGTMGVVYGAGGLWNWKLSADEPGWPDWANSNVSWREAILLPGAEYVGYLAKALDGIDITDIEKHPELAEGNLCLAKPGELFIVYLPEGGSTKIDALPAHATFRWFDPKKGAFATTGTVTSNVFEAPSKAPFILIVQQS